MPGKTTDVATALSDSAPASSEGGVPVRRRFRFLALVTLFGTVLVPTPAQALTYVQINAETLATDSSFCGSATNTFTVPSYMTLAVVGETGRLTGSCGITLADKAR